MYLFIGRDNLTDDLGQGTIAQPGEAGKGHIDPMLFTNATTYQYDDYFKYLYSTNEDTSCIRGTM
jgi:hypothetical protein